MNMNNSLYIKQDDITDIGRIDDYNKEYLSVYPNFKPFVTKENFNEFLEEVENKKHGINNDGIKEIFYFAIEDNKIVGHGSIRLNPELNNEIYIESGHIMYGVVPSKRKKGYWTMILKLLLEEAKKYNLTEVFITCNENNIGSNKIILNNNGEFVEKVKCNDVEINRYKIKL